MDIVKYPRGFVEHTHDLMLNISSNTTVVPDDDATRPFADIVSEEGIPMIAAKEAVDIGVDTNSASRKITKKQRARIVQTRNRAKGVGCEKLLPKTTVLPKARLRTRIEEKNPIRG